MSRRFKFIFNKFCFVCIFSIVTMTGCSRYKVVDQINIVDIMGFDQTENNAEEMLLGGVLIHEYRTSQEKDSVKPILTEAKTATESMTDFNQKSSYHLEIGKTRILVFGEEFAKQVGISEIVSSICRLAKIGNNMKLVVSKDPLPVLFEKLSQEEGDFLYNLLEQNMVYNVLPYSNLQTFLFDYYGYGRDAVVPYIEISEKGDIIANKTGVIGADHKLGLVLEKENTFLLKLVGDRSKESFFTIPIHKEGREGTITLKSLNGHSKVIPNKKNQSFTVHITLNTMVLGYPDWIDLKTDYPLMEKQSNKHLERQYKDLFESLKEKEIDPLGIGDSFRSIDKKWEEKKFYSNDYKNLDMNSTVNVKLLQSGVGDDGSE